jgi:SSS family solute:Na+ symporter
MIPAIIVFAYLAIVLYVGIFAFRRTRKGSAEDFFVANRSLGTFVFLLSLFGTNMTSFSILGASGLAYRVGIGVFGLMASISAVVLPVMLYLIGTRIWAIGKKFGHMTQVQIFRDRWDDRGHIGTVIFALQALMLVPYIIIGVMGGGETLEGISSKTVPYWLGGAVVALVVMSYVFFGGMRGTAWVNTLQTLMFLTFGTIAFIIIARGMGGFTKTVQAAATTLEPPVGQTFLSAQNGPFAQRIIVIGDRLQLNLGEVTGPGQSVASDLKVDQNGDVQLPLVGSVKARGRTAAELETAIAQEYRDKNLIPNAPAAITFAPPSARPTIGEWSVRFPDKDPISTVIAYEKPLRPGDVIELSLTETTGAGIESAKTLTIDRKGNITLPLLGKIPAAGKTGPELVQAIHREYASRAINIGPMTIRVRLFSNEDSTLRTSQFNPATQPGAQLTRHRIPQGQYLSYALIPLSSIMFPHIAIFCLTARRMTSFKKTVIFYPICILLIWLPSVFLGAIARLQPDIVAKVGPNSDGVMLVMLQHYAPVMLAGILGAAIMACVMASDSQILALSTMWANDVYRYYGGTSEAKQVWSARIFVVACTITAYVIALAVRQRASIFDLSVQYAFAGYASLFPVMVACLFWKRSTKWGALAATLWVAATLIGTSLLQYYTQDVAPKTAAGPATPIWSVGDYPILLRDFSRIAFTKQGYLIVLPMFFGSALLMCLVSLLTPPPSRETIARYFPEPGQA